MVEILDVEPIDLEIVCNSPSSNYAIVKINGKVIDLLKLVNVVFEVGRPVIANFEGIGVIKKTNGTFAITEENIHKSLPVSSLKVNTQVNALTHELTAD